jgi:hypothetical protein
MRWYSKLGIGVWSEVRDSVIKRGEGFFLGLGELKGCEAQEGGEAVAS